jgi:carbamoyltransferase
MYILGINAYHGDSSACLVKNGQLLSAVEEERFKRIKHWAGFPLESIQYCLNEAGIQLNDVEHVAINTDPKANLLKKINFTLMHRPDIRMIIDRVTNKKERSDVKEELMSGFPGQMFSGEVHYIEHHLAHLASSHLVSPFSDSVSVSVDGFGDFSSTAWGECNGTAINVKQRVYFPHSMGIFYQAMTQFIGFPNYGDEYKVMGLAPFGKSTYLDKMREILISKQNGTFELNLDYFRHHNENVEYEWSGGSPVVGRLFNKTNMEKLFGIGERDKGANLEQQHYDLAHSAQLMYEEVFFNMLNTLHTKYRKDELTLAGGCAMNSVANGKVYRSTPFKKMYIQSAAGDAGGAIGAAYIVVNKHEINKERFHMSHAYWGPSYNDDDHKNILNEHHDKIKSEGCSVEYFESEDELCHNTAKAISEGLVIGWFQGRMEWGPRALGNRSILGDPRRADMKDILNLKIKRRESFRPFAPSILRERVIEWFEEESDVPFMMQVFQILESKRHDIPAVTHIDGSGRLQTVSKETNPRYHKLISTFHDLTNVPILLNTSFNENEPVVCKPEEALNCFLRTKMDVLVLGNWFISRSK